MELTGERLTIGEATQEVLKELSRANKEFSLFNSKHEGISIIREEFEEMWDEIKEKNVSNVNVQAKCIQLGAMAIKFLISDIY